MKNLEITEYRFEENRKMHGVKRVLVFCILIVILPATLIIIPLYLRKTVFADVVYPVAESDIIEIRAGISSIFCKQHSLRMSSSFNAFQLGSKPEISTNHKHIRLKKSMTLPDDTLEYWGFYLLKGAEVHLKFCSRYDGSRILVVKGQRDLKTCGLLDHNRNKLGANLAQGHEQVRVFFEDITEIAGNVHIDALLTNDTALEQKKSDSGDMELENHGGEDLSEDDVSLASNSTTAAPKRKPKVPRKKLKKGSPNSMHNRKANESSSSDNSLKTSVEHLSHEHTPPTGSGTGVGTSTGPGEDVSNDSLSLTGRQRRHEVAPKNITNSTLPSASAEHLLKHQSEKQRRTQQVYNQLYERRTKRELVYDRKYSHGGNAVNFTETDESNSVSSFETGLFECFNGAILLAEGFPPSLECLNAHFLENGSHRMLSKHQITEDGYYYYIFYSDNDLVRNDIHAIFDIYKPTFQYSNVSDTQSCIDVTNCTFSIGFLSDEIVVVEVPTRDGIEHEEDDITTLISTCHPRTEIYAIFPITVLILIMSCSFL